MTEENTYRLAPIGVIPAITLTRAPGGVQAHYSDLIGDVHRAPLSVLPDQVVGTIIRDRPDLDSGEGRKELRATLVHIKCVLAAVAESWKRTS